MADLEEFKRERMDRKCVAVTTMPIGNPWLDDCLAGGLNRNNLVLVAAKTGVGKTFFGIQLARHAAKNGKKVLYFALEAERHEILRRQLYYEVCRMMHKYLPSVRVPRYREWLHQYGEAAWDTLEDEAAEKLASEMGGLQTLYRTSIYTPENFREDVERLSLPDEFEKPDLIVLDHLHHFFLSGNELEALKLTIHGIKRLHQQLEIPIVILSQLRKDDGGKSMRNRTLPAIEDIRGTAALTDIATDVMIISPVPRAMFDELPEGFRMPMFFHLAKSRTAPEAREFVGVVPFDPTTGGYGTKYCMYSHQTFEDPKPTENKDIPDWAKNVKRQKEEFIHNQPRQKYKRKDHDDDE